MPAAAAPVAQTAALPNLTGTSLTVLQWQSFIPGADDFFRKQIEEGFMKETGARVVIEFVNADDLQPKIAAAIQSGAGPDIVQFQYGWQHIYKDAVVDVTDIVAELKRSTGDFYPQIEAACNVGGRYLGVPHDLVGLVYHWRRSWFAEAGADRFPATYAELHAVGARLKENGRPLGQALSNTFGDPPTWCYPMLWAYGGREVDEQGKVAINSPETIAAVREMADAWRPAYDETGLGWDGSSNNRAFLAETISGTLNGASIWWVARKDSAPFFEDIGLDLLPAGPKAKTAFAINNNYAIMKYTGAADAAKAFIRWSMSDPVWMPWFEFCGSYYNGVGPVQDTRAPWEKFPREVQVFKELGPITRAPGWPGPWSQQAAVAQAKSIIVSMFAKAVQGDAPETAVAWAEGELKQIYT
ncbi:MAG: extracellular solute-binding protein [Chloroflexota bacterium]|nr:extracellular solute-binding protein [Chloroflexota bacterium]